MAETADIFTSISVVERVASIGSGETELTAVVDRANFLEYRVNSLKDAAVQFLELAKLNRVIDAVVLHVVGIG